MRRAADPSYNEIMYATVAQSVEQLIRNQQVAGSSPASSSKDPSRSSAEDLCFSVFRLSFRPSLALSEAEGRIIRVPCPVIARGEVPWQSASPVLSFRPSLALSEAEGAASGEIRVPRSRRGDEGGRTLQARLAPGHNSPVGCCGFNRQCDGYAGATGITKAGGALRNVAESCARSDKPCLLAASPLRRFTDIYQTRDGRPVPYGVGRTYTEGGTRWAVCAVRYCFSLNFGVQLNQIVGGNAAEGCRFDAEQMYSYSGGESMIHILIVEDEKPISNLIRLSLKKAGYDCSCAYDGAEAADLIEKQSFDLILLDIMLPEIDGFSLMEYIRPMGIPVIFLTAKNAVADRVRGLNMGAEDYLVKPFEIIELLARVNVVLRRYNKTAAELRVGGLVIDTQAMLVTKDGGTISLTPKEYELLLLFARNPGIALYRETIYERVWNEEYPYGSKTVDLHVQRLRKKLGWEDILHAVPKVGYRLEGKP